MFMEYTSISGKIWKTKWTIFHVMAQTFKQCWEVIYIVRQFHWEFHSVLISKSYACGYCADCRYDFKVKCKKESTQHNPFLKTYCSTWLHCFSVRFSMSLSMNSTFRNILAQQRDRITFHCFALSFNTIWSDFFF